ncbi:YhcN/YlaJ family sporulation lipoprotein [Bacillus sp. FJAT-49736]|uniref:YhcN/YlaJ family sporulation lipoprotein n=1 Tax=Bacillus sp. FJAT-49736 TaxID=2833582 RepID=UPI001BC990B6|nr:YhcN/YlaJ family sporulation lipoprotein [Bacillus sp. FJAT-49736]MBS4172378.1 YhcN/YlaJ family sporulation lipoprotein [Bacillus sp. FJAT-49736]
MQRIFLFIGLFLLLTSCSQRNGVAENNRNNYNPQPVAMKNNNNGNTDRKSGQEISKRLVQLATDVPGVNEATAVVFGKYAIVGIDINGDLERSEVGTIKYSVAESLKHDPYGAEAIVVADPDINDRLKEIAADIRAGKPGQGIIRELADIAGRLMPEIPKNIIPAKNPDKAPNAPKDQLNKHNDRNLEKQQENQSNHKK